MGNPFEDQDALFLALVNDFGQASVWPAFLDVPAGWRAVCGPGSRDEILAMIATLDGTKAEQST